MADRVFTYEDGFADGVDDAAPGLLAAAKGVQAFLVEEVLGLSPDHPLRLSVEAFVLAIAVAEGNA